MILETLALILTLGSVVAFIMHLLYKWDVNDQMKELTGWWCDFCICFHFSWILLIPIVYFLVDWQWAYVLVPLGATAIAMKLTEMSY